MRALVAVALAVLLAACANPASSAAPSASRLPTATPGGLAACGALDLRDPDAVRVDLTGTWRKPGGGPVYYIYQEGDCFWYAGGFAASDGTQDWGPLGLYTIVFEGTVSLDFTIAGRWAIVRMAGNSFSGNAWHDKTWTVTFEPQGGGYATVLTSPADEAGGSISTTRLEKVSDAVVEP
jgi:hypothetical protein